MSSGEETKKAKSQYLIVQPENNDLLEGLENGFEISFEDLRLPHRFHHRKGFLTRPETRVNVGGRDHFFRLLDLPAGSSTLVFDFGISEEQPPLTPELLTSRVIPVLSALCKIEKVVNKNICEEPRIVAISQQSPVNVSMTGIPEAYKALREDIMPWRRKHNKKIAELNEQEKQADIERKRAEVAEATARTEKERAEAAKIRAESLRIEAEARKLEFALKKEQIEFAYSLVNKMAPDATQVEQLTLFKELLPHLEALSLSNAGLSLPDDGES